MENKKKKTRKREKESEKNYTRTNIVYKLSLNERERAHWAVYHWH